MKMIRRLILILLIALAPSPAGRMVALYGDESR